MNRIPIDSPNLGRTKPTPNLNTLGLRTQQTNKFLRNTCTNNSDFLLANRLGAGSYGFKRSPTALEKYINAFEERQRVCACVACVCVACVYIYVCCLC